MDHVLHGQHFDSAYVDDVLIVCAYMEEYILQLQLVSVRFDKCGVVINTVECEFGNSEVIF